MTIPSETIRVVIPRTVRPRNGRPRIMPPEEIDTVVDGPAPDQRLLRAIARARDWRRRLKRGEVATIEDIAAAEGVRGLRPRSLGPSGPAMPGRQSLCACPCVRTTARHGHSAAARSSAYRRDNGS